jgi:sugar phosphate isomerase/epimerase
VFAQASPRIGLSLDTAWALDAGEDPVKMIEEFGPRLALVHLKDFVFDRARKPEDVVVGTGNLPLPNVAAALAKAGFDGELVIEYEGDVANPVPALTACVQAIRREMDIAT